MSIVADLAANVKIWKSVSRYGRLRGPQLSCTCRVLEKDVEKSHILKSPFIHLYIRPTNYDARIFFSQNALSHTVNDSISDSIFHPRHLAAIEERKKEKNGSEGGKGYSLYFV